MKRVISIDLSSNTMGFAVFYKSVETLKVVSSGILNFGTETLDGMKLRHSGQQIQDFFKDFPPDIILLEEIPHCRMKKVAIALGKIHGIFYEQLSIFDENRGRFAEIYEVNNLTWKKMLCGVGNASKVDIRQHILLHEGFFLKTFAYDESDAIGLGLAFLKNKPIERNISKKARNLWTRLQKLPEN